MRLKYYPYVSDMPNKKFYVITDNYRRLYFGDLKTAIAKDSAGNVIYELVYLDAIDGMINNNGVGVSPVIYTNNNIYYPGSVNNMRRQLELLALSLTSYIGVDEYNLPKFMRTPQAGYYKPTNYVQVIPICYALPGQGSKIISRIKLTNFDFKQFDFEIDRIIVQTSKDSNTAKYLILERQAIGDLIEVDNYLFGPEGNVRIEDEDSNPLIIE